MPILQFQCSNCSSVFEHMVSLSTLEVDCMACGSDNIFRLNSTYFYPNKNFCPHDKELESEKLKSQLAKILLDKSAQCGGCGTDGAPGRCNSKGGGCSCGAGGCGSSSSNGCRSPVKFAKLL